MAFRFVFATLKLKWKNLVNYSNDNESKIYGKGINALEGLIIIYPFPAVNGWAIDFDKIFLYKNIKNRGLFEWSIHLYETKPD